MPGAEPSETVSATVRQRDHLTETEIDKLMTVSRAADNGQGKRSSVLVAFRHGLRASELLICNGIRSTSPADDPHSPRQGGDPSTHHLSNRELRSLRRLQGENPPGPHVFVSERGGPLTTAWFGKCSPDLGGGPRCHSVFTRTCCGIVVVSCMRTWGRTLAACSSFGSPQR